MTKPTNNFSFVINTTTFPYVFGSEDSLEATQVNQVAINMNKGFAKTWECIDQKIKKKHELDQKGKFTNESAVELRDKMASCMYLVTPALRDADAMEKKLKSSKTKYSKEVLPEFCEENKKSKAQLFAMLRTFEGQKKE